jgi:hypothetical protein
MNLQFFQRSADDRALIIRETAARRGISPVMVEKDFWVSWILAVSFGHREFGSQLVFKGGTSLSKVFGVIDRFSEDIDLSVSPVFLGIEEKEVHSRKQAEAQMKQLETACIERVRERFLPELERVARESLGKCSGSGTWMEFQVDLATHSPVVLFHYPSTEPTGFEYLKRAVKMEFGSLTDQRPVGVHPVKPWVAEAFEEHFADFRCALVALELERTFWEKATILHSEYHRDKSKPMRDRFSRHYSDMAALARHNIVRQALANPELARRVAEWKDCFFPARWARYDLAKPGTFRLAPPDFRVAELESDYKSMHPMFLATPPPFANIMETVRNLEERINMAA